MPIEKFSDALDAIIEADAAISEHGSGYGGSEGPAEGPLWWADSGDGGGFEQRLVGDAADKFHAFHSQYVGDCGNSVHPFSSLMGIHQVGASLGSRLGGVKRGRVLGLPGASGGRRDGDLMREIRVGDAKIGVMVDATSGRLLRCGRGAAVESLGEPFDDG